MKTAFAFLLVSLLGISISSAVDTTTLVSVKTESKPIELTHLKAIKVSVKLQGFYYAGQVIKENGLKVSQNGYYDIPLNLVPSLLIDGNNAWDSSIVSNYWSGQAKRFYIDIDLAGVYTLSTATVETGSDKQEGVLVNSCEILTSRDGFAANQLASIDVQTNPNTAQKAVRYTFKLDLQNEAARYVRIICSSESSAMMVISEFSLKGIPLENK